MSHGLCKCRTDPEKFLVRSSSSLKSHLSKSNSRGGLQALLTIRGGQTDDITVVMCNSYIFSMVATFLRKNDGSLLSVALTNFRNIQTWFSKKLHHLTLATTELHRSRLASHTQVSCPTTRFHVWGERLLRACGRMHTI